MTVHVFVDETKAKSYMMVAAVGLPSDLQISRKELNELLRPGQRSLHMNSESDSRRRLVADTIARMIDLGVRATIYDAGRGPTTEKVRRGRCLEAIVIDVLEHDQARIVIDRDDTLMQWDRQQLIELTRGAHAQDRITYVHHSRSEEPLLAIPDAIAWCWAKGGDWRRRVEPIVQGVRVV